MEEVKDAIPVDKIFLQGEVEGGPDLAGNLHAAKGQDWLPVSTSVHTYIHFFPRHGKVHIYVNSVTITSVFKP